MSATLKSSGVLTNREKLWEAIRRLAEFNVYELAGAAKVDRHKYSVQDYLKALTVAGILSKIPAKFPGDFSRYRLVLDVGVDAPRVRKDGSFPPETAQNRMWRAMKVLREFSTRDLVVHASLPDSTIADTTASIYCRWLEAGGYLVAADIKPSRYRLVKNTGAKAPQILRIKQLYDPNTGKVVATENPLDVMERDNER